MTTARTPARRIAVIGSGVSGLTAGYVLRGSAEVTVYEADDRLGGHAHTHDIVGASGTPVAVDTGFIVHNRRTYPTLLRIFDELDVTTQESEMSMSVVCDGCGLQYAGARGAKGLFAIPSAPFRGRYLRMLAEVPRFHRAARALLADGTDDVTLADFVARHGWSPYFRTHFLTPLVSAVWSTAPEHALEFPARYLFAFLDNHGMLAVTGSPTWRTVTGGSRSYVEALAKRLSTTSTSTPVREVVRHADGVTVRDAGDGVAEFDGVVVATHPDQALALLADPTARERELLAALPYTPNETWLHHDTSVLPSAPAAAASWNYRMSGCAADGASVLVSYDMNRLQRLRTPDRYVVTLNARGHVDETTVLARMRYAHPLYTPASVAARAALPELNTGRTAFAGAYHGWGFHEDGARSGLAAATSLGGRW